MLTLKEKIENKNKKKAKEKLGETYSPRYKVLWGGVKKCMICGFAVAKDEERMHSIYHDSFLKFKKEVNELNGFDLILTHEKAVEFNDSIEQDRKTILSGGCDLKFKKEVLSNIIWREFNEYHSFRGYNSKKNINYDKFIGELFKKEHFIDELQVLFNKDFNKKLLIELKNQYQN